MKFSVLMSVYDKEKSEYLKEALQSLVDQTLLPDEVILVEDGPIGKNLQEVIKKYRSLLNIKSIKLENNCGLAVALNEGLKHCTHDLVARMDTDDISLPERFEKQIAYMQNNPDISVSSGWIEEIDDQGRFFCLRKLPETHEELVNFAK